MFLGGTIVALLVTVLMPASARAQQVPLVALDRNPVLLSRAMPDEFVCAYDEDDNGLDDAIEKQLAQELVPQFRFDAAEEHTGSGEPRAVFSTRVSLNDLGERIITVRYVFVWHEDGGFVSDAGLSCGDAHAGDTQPMTATVRLMEGQDRWFAQLETLAGFTGVFGVLPAAFLDYEEAHPLGDAHDDVWSIPLPSAGAWKPAIRVRPDSGTQARVSAKSVLASTADGASVRAWSLGTEDGAGVVAPLVRTDRGWLELGEQGLPMADTCPEGDLDGGELCRLAPAWWASPGTRACEDAPEVGTCAGAPGEMLAETPIQTTDKVADAVTDGSTIWVLTKSKLYRKQLDEGGQMRDIATMPLTATGRALAVSGGQVLLGTDAGVQVVQQQGNTLVFGEVTELCGRPLRIAPVTGSLWAVNTTLGTVLVTTGPTGAPLVQSSSVVVPGCDETFPLPGPAVCRDVDRFLGEAAVEVLGRISALAAAPGQRLLVARGPFVVDLDVRDAAAPVVRHTEYVRTGLQWIRVDEMGGRAYGFGQGLPGQSKPVLDLREGRLELVGQHDVPAWVRRDDEGRLSVWVQGPRRVQVAEVLR